MFGDVFSTDPKRYSPPFVVAGRDKRPVNLQTEEEEEGGGEGCRRESGS